MKKNLLKVFYIIGFTALAAACGSIYESEPVGIGSDISELKRSPCACMLLKLPENIPDWMTVHG